MLARRFERKDMMRTLRIFVVLVMLNLPLGCATCRENSSQPMEEKCFLSSEPN